MTDEMVDGDPAAADVSKRAPSAVGRRLNEEPIEPLPTARSRPRGRPGCRANPGVTPAAWNARREAVPTVGKASLEMRCPSVAPVQVAAGVALQGILARDTWSAA